MYEESKECGPEVCRGEITNITNIGSDNLRGGGISITGSINKNEVLREFNIGIKFLSSGCVVEVGCKSIAFSTNEEAILSLNDYFNDPVKTREEFQKRFGYAN